jgi:galactonate dehydratase
MWFEEPVPRHFPDELARVSQALPMPTASAEQVFGMVGFRPFLTRPVVDVVMPDVKHAGGLRAVADIAAAAKMRQVLVAPHNPSGPVATVATGHVVSTLENLLILEYAWGEVGWRVELLSPPEPVQAGYLAVSHGPGLGHSLDPALVAEHRRARPSSGDSTRVVV